MAIRVILASGIVVFALLLVTAALLRRAATPDERFLVKPRGAQTAFQGNRAHADLIELAGYGPRIPGSEGSDRARAWIERGLRAAGLRVRRDGFETTGPEGAHSLVNLTGIVRGTQPGVTVLTTHYDTVDRGDASGPGASGSASGVALLLEMARVIGPEREGNSVWLCFFDGGEWGPSIDMEDRHYGSARFVDDLQESGEDATVKLVVHVEGPGDRYLGIDRDTAAPQVLWDTVRNHAVALGYANHFKRTGGAVAGGHTAFAAAGVPAVALADRQHGGSLADHRRIWRTPMDNLDNTSADSLQAVGDVLVKSLGDLEARVGALVR